MNKLQKLLDLFDKLNKGLIKPSKIVGTGLKNPKKAAYEYLQEKIKLQIDIAMDEMIEKSINNEDMEDYLI